MRRLRILLVLVVACAKPAPAPVVAPAAVLPVNDHVAPVIPAEPVSEPLTLATNMKVSTKAGTSFDAPTGWTVQTSPTRVTLDAPEKNLRATILDVDAATADEAIARAWARVDPTMKRAVQVAHPVPGRRGWDERKAVVYVVSPNEKRVVTAIALRHNNFWSALLLDGAQATFEKRMSQIALIGQSLAPAGYIHETFAGLLPKTLDKASITRIVDMIDEGRKTAGIPGVALALVQGGKVVYSGGLGVRELGKKSKVTDRTRFMIASNTKALTTLMLAALVDEHRFTWETPVTEVNPAFALGSPETTKQVLVKHLICACTGMPRQDFEWLFEFATRTPASTMQMLMTMQPTSGFGEVFQYSNVMASAAGYSAGAGVYKNRELGSAYDQLMQTRVFAPLGMSDTTFDFKKALSADHAMPHGYDVDGNVVGEDLSFDRAIVPMRPAGGAWSSARDVTRYVQLELANGKLPGGKQLVSAENIGARAQKQVAIGEDAVYGMGLIVDKQYGTPIVHHGGDLSGYHSDMFWLPEAQVGGVILTNADAGVLLRQPFIRRTIEMLYDAREEAREDMLSAITRMKDQIARERLRLVMPPEGADGLAEHYVSDALGSLAVRKSGNDVVFDFGEWQSSMASRRNDDGTMSLVTIQPGVAGFELVVDTRDGKRVLILRDGQHEYVFSERLSAERAAGSAER